MGTNRTSENKIQKCQATGQVPGVLLPKDKHCKAGGVIWRYNYVIRSTASNPAIKIPCIIKAVYPLHTELYRLYETVPF